MPEIAVELVFFIITFFVASSLIFVPVKNDFGGTYQWVYSNRMLLSFLEYRYENISMLNLIRYLKCNEINVQIPFQDILNRTNKGYFYILYSPDNVHVYNLQDSVCMDELKMNSFLFNTSCGMDKMFFSIWDEKVKEVC